MTATPGVGQRSSILSAEPYGWGFQQWNRSLECFARRSLVLATGDPATSRPSAASALAAVLAQSTSRLAVLLGRQYAFVTHLGLDLRPLGIAHQWRDSLPSAALSCLCEEAEIPLEEGKGIVGLRRLHLQFEHAVKCRLCQSTGELLEIDISLSKRQV